MEAVLSAFLRENEAQIPEVVAASDVLHLMPDRRSGDPPRVIHGVFTDVEHFVRDAHDTFQTSRRPLAFVIHYPDDYCSCVDGTLQLRVAHVMRPIAHPNVGGGGTVCLGPTFRPSTQLRPLVEHIHRICSARVFASQSPFESGTAEFYRRHTDRVRALCSAPLWRRPLAQRVNVAAADPTTRGIR